MTPDNVVQIIRQALMSAFWVAAPLLAIGFIVGIAISLVQIATSMQDTAFSTVPRLIAFMTGVLLLMPWMLQKLMAYTTGILGTSDVMPINLTLSVGTLYAFLLVLARVGGALVFVPLPGFTGAPQPVRAALALGFTLALSGRWPAVNAEGVTVTSLTAWIAAEAAIGIAMGVAVAIVIEAFVVAAQVLGLQAGYAYASTIDPNTQADSGILLVFAQLAAGMLFFALGLDREVLRLFAQSLDTVPVGTYVFGRSSAEALIQLGSGMFSTGVRLALPVVALLVMVDVALALMGRLNQQLQLISLAFPAKMLTALLILSWIAVLMPRIMMQLSAQSWTVARRMLGM